MYISTDLLLKVHDTFGERGSTGDTCKLLLYPHYSTTSCPQCPAVVRKYAYGLIDTACGLSKANPDFQPSLDQFYQLYPEYAI